MPCRYPTCGTQRVQRWGLCNKHRKWIERGYMTAELVLTGPSPERVEKRCKVPLCKEKTRRHGFCERHSWDFKRGKRFLDGSLNPAMRKIRYSRDFECIKCGRKGKITKGFCRTHYNQYRKGLIDFDGVETGNRKRIWKYAADEICKVINCNKKPRGRGFCNLHLEPYTKGFYDDDGKRLIPVLIKNKGRKCKVCDKPANCKGLCRTHYSRLLNKKSLVRTYRNKNQHCRFAACRKPAYAKRLCSVHYDRFRHGRSMFDAGPKRMVCIMCDRKVLAYDMCKKHYSRIRYENIRALKQSKYPAENPLVGLGFSVSIPQHLVSPEHYMT